jgi:beta-lactamase regulating signal transducer with metallopeptidase domain
METIDRYLLTFLLNSLWQVPAAVLIAAVACRLMRSGPSRHRHAVCVAGLAAALLLPATSVRVWTGNTQSIAVPMAAPSSGGTAPAAAAAPRAAAPTTSRTARLSVPFPWTAAVLVLWGYFAFLVYRLLVLARAAWKTARICRTATAQGPDRSAVWTRCREAFGLDGVELRWSTHVSGPVTAGRIVILPIGMAEANDDVLATAIGHEMAHIVRRDFALNVLFELIVLPISFQPAAVWLRREIDRMRELACDELVTSRLLEPEVYAHSIVQIAAGMPALTRPGYTLGVFDGDILEERIRRLLERRVENLKRARVVLAAGVGSLAACVVIASGLAISARAQSPAQQEMRAAGEAYNSGYYAQAAEHFQKAVALEPGNANARLYLASAYLQQYRAAGKFDSNANNPSPLILNAREQYGEVLRRDPKNVTAAFGFVSVGGPKSVDESRDLMMKVIADDPKNKEAYYTIGVFDWQAAFRPIVDANQGAGPSMYRQIADPAQRAQLRTQFMPRIEEAFRMLQIAIDIDPMWADPMAYMNLVHRLKAPLLDDPAEAAKEIAQADAWVSKAVARMPKRNPAVESRQPAPQIDVDQPAPQAIPSLIPAPPPPPPPPGYRGNGDGKVPPPPPPPPPPKG